MPAPRKTTALAAAGLLTLALAACSSPPTGAVSDGVEYSFTPPPGAIFIGPAQKLTITVPDPLQQIAAETSGGQRQSYLDNKILDRVVIEALPTQSAKNCAVQMTLTYAEDAVKRIEHSQFAYTPTSLAGGPQADSEPSLDDKVARSVAGYSESDPVHMGEPNLADPEIGLYFSPDYTQMTQVARCVTEPTGGTSVGQRPEVRFSFLRTAPDGQTQPSSLASAEVNVMKNGDLYVVKSKVQDYTLDTNGTWVETD